MLSKVWEWADGKKTYIGLALTAVGGLTVYFGLLSATFPSVRWIIVTAGVLQTINGLLHKAYKTKYGIEHSDNLVFPADK